MQGKSNAYVPPLGSRVFSAPPAPQPRFFMGLNGQSKNGRPPLWKKSPLAFLKRRWAAEGGLPVDWKEHLEEQIELWREQVGGLKVGDQESAALCLGLYRAAVEETDVAKKVRAVANFERLARACGFLKAGLREKRGRGKRQEGLRRIPTSGQVPQEDGTENSDSQDSSVGPTDGAEEV